MGHEAELVGLDVSRQADFEDELLNPTMPELVGVTEIAEALGVSKQRVSELSQQDVFPRPVSRLAAGAVWLASSVRRFQEVWPRKPGRSVRAV